MRRSKALIALSALLAAVLVLAACGGGDDDGGGSADTDGGETQAESGPITIGAAIDQSSTMEPFDGPALAAAQIRAQQINDDGGVAGRQIRFDVRNTQLKPDTTKAAAAGLADDGAQIGWVTCDVDFATPSTQEFLGRNMLTVSPCIGTDQMGPKRFGEAGKLAFSLGNAAQDEGAAIAETAYNVKEWRSAIVVTDNVIVYEQNVCEAFTNRYEELGGEIVAQESFTQGDGTINSVVSNVNRADADVIILCTLPGEDLPAFVSGVRQAGNETPIFGPWSLDGAFWLPKNPRVSNNIWYVTYASVYGDDPNPEVQQMIDQLTEEGNPPATGGFVTGAAAVDAIATAVEEAGGSTEGAELAEKFESFQGLPTVSGAITFTPELHSVSGREYRLMEVKDGKPRFTELVSASSPAQLGE